MRSTSIFPDGWFFQAHNTALARIEYRQTKQPLGAALTEGQQVKIKNIKIIKENEVKKHRTIRMRERDRSWFLPFYLNAIMQTPHATQNWVVVTPAYLFWQCGQHYQVLNFYCVRFLWPNVGIWNVDLSKPFRNCIQVVLIFFMRTSAEKRVSAAI